MLHCISAVVVRGCFLCSFIYVSFQWRFRIVFTCSSCNMNNRTFQRDLIHSIRLKMHCNCNLYINYWIIYLFFMKILYIGILKVICLPPNDFIIVNSAIALNIVYCIEFLQNKIKTIISFCHIFDPRASKARMLNIFCTNLKHTW